MENISADNTIAGEGLRYLGLSLALRTFELGNLYHATKAETRNNGFCRPLYLFPHMHACQLFKIPMGDFLRDDLFQNSKFATLYRERHSLYFDRIFM
jgi:hypothetical protein